VQSTRRMSGMSVAAKNRVVAGGLVAFVSATYGYTMMRMKASTDKMMDEFSSTAPAKDAGK
jgi:hypothetical protein